MQRFAVGIEFCGMHYRGWQTQQPGVASVQETIEKVLSRVADQPISYMVPDVPMRGYMRPIWWHILIAMPFVLNVAG